MDRDNFLAPIVVIALSALFLLISLLMFFRPENAKLTKRKIRTGAAIIALTSLISTQQGCVATCYDAPEPQIPNEIQFQNIYSDTIEINIPEGNVITGIIKNINTSQFEFKILASDTIVFEGIIVATDGAFNSNEEDFMISIPNEISTGIYDLLIFAGRYESIENYYAKYILIVNGE